MKILHTPPPHLLDVATLHWEIQKKSFSAVLFIHTSDDYLCYLRKKTTAIHLPTSSENVTTLRLELDYLHAENKSSIKTPITGIRREVRWFNHFHWKYFLKFSCQQIVALKSICEIQQ